MNAFLIPELESRQFMEEADSRTERTVKRFTYVFVIGFGLTILTLSAMDIMLRSLGYMEKAQRYKPFKYM